MKELFWVAMGVLTVSYLIVGLKVLGTYFWCFGTAQSNPTKKVKFINGLITFGLTLLWPLFFAWLLGMWVYSYYQHRQLMKKKPRHYTCIDKGGRYKCYGETTGAGTSKGESVVIYQDVDSKKLYHRTRDDFDKRMKLMSK